MNLRDIVLESKDVWVDYEGLEGFSVNVSYVNRDTSAKIRAESLKTKLVNGIPHSEVDNEKFLTAFVAIAIKGWKGLTIDHVSKLLLIDPEVLSKDPNMEVPFSTDNAMMLISKSAAFDAFINGIVFNLDSFR